MRNKSVRVKISRFFTICFCFSFLIAIIKLFYVAVSHDVDGINLTEFAKNRNTVKKTLYASRGNIYDVNGEIIAQNVNSYTLIAYLSESRTTDPKNPEHVVDKERTAASLASILGVSKDYILSRLKTENAYQVEFGVAGKNLSEHQKVLIEALDLPGIDFISGSKRYYKKSKMASYIVGYAKARDDGEIVGEMGVEGYYNDILKGTNGESIYQVSAVGYQMGEAYTTESTSGSDIYLTLDTQIQLILEDAVHTLEENNEFDWFTFTVMNAKTGAIVGSATSPNFNPNTLDGLENYVNPLVGYTYEPGSTMKIFSWLAAMENGIYDGKEEFMSGSIKIKGATIKDFNNKGWGKISYDTGFAYSSNVGATNLALKLGNVKLREFYESLGFGKKTGLELPGEESGIIRLTYESELASASFGQGITTTPIQTLQALSVLTNDGVMLKPFIVDKIVDANGNVTYEGKREELGKKVSSESIKKINKLMYDVVYNGTSEIWKTKNVTLAGKTGTGEIASPNGGYLTGNINYIRSFAGVFPYENPEYIIYASVKQIDGGASALARVVTKAVESIANYANIMNADEVKPNSKIVNLNNYLSEDVETSKEALKNAELVPIVIGNGKNVINQFPLQKTEVLKGSKVFLLTADKNYTMIDIKGWSSSEVLNFCNLLGLKVKFEGFGVVDSFNFKVNTKINLSKTLEVTLKAE